MRYGQESRSEIAMCNMCCFFTVTRNRTMCGGKVVVVLILVV